MSTTVATRAGRFAPPAEPTRKRASTRRVTGDRAAVVGRTDRPVLRIVADDRQTPVITRIRPGLTPEPSIELTPAPSVDPVDTTGRRVDLTEFFAADYDGDDVAVEILGPRPSTLRLTRRGRLVVFGVSLAAVLAVGFAAATSSLAGGQPEPTRVVHVQPGQTLWDIAAGVSDGNDVRSTMTHLEAINHLDSSTLQVGQALRVPR
jgi:LysM repeat protein